MTLKSTRDMMEKVNISQVMNQCQVVTDVDYVFVEEGNSQGKIKKENLVHISPKLGFNGDFKDPQKYKGYDREGSDNRHKRDKCHHKAAQYKEYQE